MQSPGKRILIIDDDVELNSLLTRYLGRFGFEVSSETRPAAGLSALQQDLPDLIILDVMLPGMDGFEVCRRIRREFTVPVIMLTARGEVMDRVVGLELGADDYIPKPFEPRELVARIQTILRRTGVDGTISGKRNFGDLRVDFGKHQVVREGLDLQLTTAEFEILAFLIRHQDQVMSREQLLDHMRGIEMDIFNRSIDVLISRVRQKLNDDARQPRYIRTVRGSGYLFIGREDHDH